MTDKPVSYLVELKPAEPYSFGTDQNIAYPGERKTGKESYFVKSFMLPEQTTLLGALRYIMLRKNGLLNTGFSYSEADREKMNSLIGKSSFSFEKENQSFGIIERIHPLFVTDSDGNYYIRNPFCNKSKTGFEPFRMTKAFSTSHGDIYLPDEGEYISKAGYGSGFMRLSDAVVTDDVFDSVSLMTSNNISAESGGFFKIENIIMNSKYRFAFFADIYDDGMPAECTVYLGKKKSLFRVSFTKKENDLNERISGCFSESDGSWMYALSDIAPAADSIWDDDFCITEEKSVRNLSYENNRIRKKEFRTNLIRSGSVFYCPAADRKIKVNPAADIAGYNVIIRLGGDK